MKTKLILAALLAGTSLIASAGPIEDQIKVRQSAYSFLGWNTAKIKAQVVDKPETYSKEQVIAAANVIAAISNSGLGALYGVGTDQGSGWKQTRLKPEFFSKPEEAKKNATDFNREANEFAKVAETGDIGEIKAKFGKLSESCKACHDNFRIREQH